LPSRDRKRVLMALRAIQVDESRPFDPGVRPPFRAATVRERSPRRGMTFNGEVPGRQRISFLARTLIPAALVLTLLFAALGVYFKAVTGDPLLPGYAVNQKEYGWPLVMPWQKPADPSFRHQEMRMYYEWEKGELRKKNGLVPTIVYGPYHLALGWT